MQLMAHLAGGNVQPAGEREFGPATIEILCADKLFAGFREGETTAGWASHGDRIEGIPPAIAIDQTNPVRSSRSTVGTMTELNDHMKLLYARAAGLVCGGCVRGACCCCSARSFCVTGRLWISGRL